MKSLIKRSGAAYFHYVTKHFLLNTLLTALFLAISTLSMSAFASGEIVATLNISAKSFVKSPNSDVIYATTSNDSVVVINMNTLTITDTIAVGPSPAALAVSEDGKTVYVALTGASELAVINLSTKTVRTINLPYPASDIEVGNGYLYAVQNSGQWGGIMQVNLASNVVTEFSGTTSIYQGGLLEISPDKNTLYFADRGLSPGSFYKFDISKNRPELKYTSPFDSLGEGGIDLSLTPDGKLIYYCTATGSRNPDFSGIAQLETDGFTAIGYIRSIGQITSSPYGNIAYTDMGLGIGVWDANTFTLINQYPTSESAADLIVDRSGNYLLAAFGSELRIYSAEGMNIDASVVSFSSANYFVNESDEAIIITVTRNNSHGEISVDYATTEGTALTGLDFTAVSGTLTFSEGQTTATFTVPIIKDSELESDKVILLKLTNPTNGAILSAPALSKLTIQGDVLTQNYFPIAPGSEWIYKANNALFAINVPFESVAINKVKTRTLKSAINGSKQYFTNDAQGILLHRLFVPGINIPRVGNKSVTLTAKPAIVFAPEGGKVGQTFNSYGSFHAAIPGVGSGSVAYSANYTILGGETITVPAGIFETIKLQGSIYLENQFLLSQTYYLAKGIGIVKLISTDLNGSVASELQSTNMGVHDIAVTAITPPSKVILTTKTLEITKTVKVTIQNRSQMMETIADLDTLQKFVDLKIESLGDCTTPKAQLLTNKIQQRMPISLKPKETLTVEYAVIFNCANDKQIITSAYGDYRFTATVDHSALDGIADVHQADDICPRKVKAPYIIDMYPDSQIKDLGCGAKMPNKTFGADVITDVVGP
jgi:DNA-binding beta-propeller fold protein YncE